MGRIFVTGDVHGGGKDIAKIFNFSKRMKGDLCAEDVMIIAGDWGLIWAKNPRNQDERKYKTKFNGMGLTFFVVLGNHENYDRIEKLPVREAFGGEVRYEPEYENIVYAQNGHYYTINGRLVWVMGGGQSADYLFRVAHENWWPQEVPSDEEIGKCFERFEKGRVDAIDLVVTHTCPMNLQPFDKYYHMKPGMVKRQEIEAMLQRVYDRIGGKAKWFCGHFHVDLARDVRFLLNDVVEIGGHDDK